MIRAVFLLLLYISLSVALNLYRRKHPPHYQTDSGLGSVMRTLRELWGASLWPALGLLWIIMPIYTTMHLDTTLPVGLLLWGCSILLPLLAYSSLLTWARLMQIGSFILLILFIGGTLAGAGWIFFKLHLTDVWRTLPAFLFFIMTPPTVATLLLFSWSADLVPISSPQEDGRRKALALIMGFYSGVPKPMHRIINGKNKLFIPGHSVNGIGPGWVMTESDNAVVLKGNSKIQRIVGPGGIFTRMDEVPYEILDLRQQVRTTHIQAITRDGIKVRLQITLVFQIQPGHRPPHFGLPWPYAREGAWRIVLASEVNPEGRTPLDAHLSHPWSDIPLEMAQVVIRQTVIDYTLDKLYGTPNQTLSPRQKIGADTRTRLVDRLAPQGFHIVSCNIGKITPVDSTVTEQRIKAWKSRWIRQLMTWQGTVQARRFEHFASIQNRARVDLLSHFIEATHTAIQQSGENTGWNLVAYNLLENMERLAREPEIQNFLPETALPALTELRQQVKNQNEHYEQPT